MSVLQWVVPIFTGVGGALLFPGGPLGLVAGLAVGGAADLLINVISPTPAVGTPAAVAAAGLPAGTNIAAANNFITLARIGGTYEKRPAQSWLSTFQTSVGLPATGTLDATSRAKLIAAVPSASTLPNPTFVG
jgi:hypothetical protein